MVGRSKSGKFKTYVTINGEVLGLYDAIKKYSTVNSTVVYDRINNKGWNPIEAVFAPAQKSGRKTKNGRNNQTNS